MVLCAAGPAVTDAGYVGYVGGCFQNAEYRLRYLYTNVAPAFVVGRAVVTHKLHGTTESFVGIGRTPRRQPRTTVCLGRIGRFSETCSHLALR